jgi:methionine-rich copper-binding protein CopC
MKTKRVLKLGLSMVLIVALCFVSFKSFAHKTTKTQIAKDTNVIVTIDKTTTSDEFNDIKSMLKDNGVTATFTNIERNDLNEVTGLEIELKDDNNETATSRISSNMPIAQITFGRKDGLLFISQSQTENGALGFFNQPNMFPFNFENDSIVGQNFQSFGNFNFDDFFNDDNNSFSFNGKNITIDQLREQMKKQLQSNGLNSNGLSWFFDSDDNSNKTYNFIDDPKVNKLIVIDGKECDFKKLKSLEEQHKLKVVDMLKPETAISLYGDKAKDGAIIATTK